MNEPFVPDHVRAKEHAAAARERRGPVPLRLSVTLPFDRAVEAVTYRDETFQPTEIEWQAVILNLDLGVDVWATVRAYIESPERRRLAQIDAQREDWCPPAPAWFDEQVARMRRKVDRDRHAEKLADHRIDASMGWQ